jgi:hypothetical protein
MRTWVVQVSMLCDGYTPPDLNRSSLYFICGRFAATVINSSVACRHISGSSCVFCSSSS